MYVKEAPVDRFSVGGMSQVSGQELVNKNDHSHDEEERLGRGKKKSYQVNHFPLGTKVRPTGIKPPRGSVSLK